MNNNSYIRNRAFGTFFFASVLTSLISQANTMIDGVIVGHLITPDAVSAIGLLSPILNLSVLLALIIYSGASTLVTKEIGNQNYQQASRLFTVCIVSVIVGYVCMTPVFYLFSNQIANLLTDDERLLPLIKDYLPIMFFGGIFIVILASCHMFVKVAGKPKLVIYSVSIQLVINALLDLLFVGVFGMGIKGSAIATVVSPIVAVSAYINFFRDTKCIYKLQRLDKTWFQPLLSSSFKTGLPSAVSSLAMVTLIICLNTIILNAEGADGVFVISVSMQMIMICMLVLSGAGGGIIGIGGVLLGEKNLDGYRVLVNAAVYKSCLILSILTILFVLCPGSLARLFGATGDLLSYSISPLRKVCLMILPIGVINLLSNVFILQEHRMLVSLISVGELICILPVVWLSARFFPEFIWISIPIGIWLLMFIMMASTCIISTRNKLLNWFTLIPMIPDNPSVSLSIPYQKGKLDETLSSVKLFIDICELPGNMSEDIEQCIKTISYDIISITEHIRKKGYFDIRIIDDSEQILIVIKDDCKPHNPLSSERGVLINSLCPDATYSYMNGINCSYLKFRYTRKIDRDLN